MTKSGTIQILSVRFAKNILAYATRMKNVQSAESGRASVKGRFAFVPYVENIHVFVRQSRARFAETFLVPVQKM